MYTGIEIYCAPTADARETWQASMTHIALEGGCFVLSANQFCLRKDYPPPPEYIFSGTDEDLTPDTVVCAGGSVIISPSGAVLAGPDYKGEVLITADLPIILHSKLLLLLLLRFSNVQIVCRYSWRDCPSKVWFRCGGALFKAWCAEPLDLFNLQSMTSLVQFPSQTAWTNNWISKLNNSWWIKWFNRACLLFYHSSPPPSMLYKWPPSPPCTLIFDKTPTLQPILY